VETVASDLTFLMNEWDCDIDDQSLRRSSPILRRLLVEGELQRAWKHAGYSKEPTIVAPTFDPIVRIMERSDIRMAASGGATHQGIEHYYVTEIARALPTETMQEWGTGSTESVTIQLGLRAFTEAPCLILNGQEVCRRDVIKFVANRLGGVHSSSKAERKNEQVYRLLDSARTTYTVGDKPIVFFQILAAGQSLAKSEDLRVFVERVCGSCAP
jgi:hypothetical protein